MSGPSPAGRFASLEYCSLEQVQAAMYSGQGLIGSQNPPTDTTRDALLMQLITQTSRDFDQEVWESTEYPGLFSWMLETRRYSGVGQQDLHVGPFAKMIKVEIDATPGQLQSTFQDYTIEFGQNRMGVKPIRGFPKSTLFRQATFYVDPFRLGNVRLTALWGIVQPDFSPPTGAIPNEDWEDNFLDVITTNDTIDGVTPTVASLSPDGTGNTWWKTPDDVQMAVAAWVAYKFQSRKMAGGLNAGDGKGRLNNDKSIPAEVQRVINRYRGEHNVPKFALVADDGSDTDSSGSYPAFRWAGWFTHS
jgi:hypothetical protein